MTDEEATAFAQEVLRHPERYHWTTKYVAKLCLWLGRRLRL